MSRPCVLFVQHADDAPPGWFGEWLGTNGVGYDVVHGDHRDEIPADLGDYAGLAVLGGEMGAYDDEQHPWLTPTKKLVARTVRTGRCFFGICLGHQLAAASLGGRVIRNPLGQCIGLTPVRLTPAGQADPLLGGISSTACAVQWNRDVVDQLPERATTLATAPDGTVQAARFGPRAWGVQFHPETSPAIFKSWTADIRSDHLPVGFDLEKVTAELHAAEDELRTAWAPLGARFADIVKQAAAAGKPVNVPTAASAGLAS